MNSKLSKFSKTPAKPDYTALVAALQKKKKKPKSAS
jgi:hypothetical protein